MPVLAFGQWLAFSDCGFGHTRTGRYIWLWANEDFFLRRWANVDFSDYKLPFGPGLGLKNAHLTSDILAFDLRQMSICFGEFSFLLGQMSICFGEF